ncbi:MAG: UbiA family prenyltransferase [Negativicutes bacterium]|nr:UbiA family prenyltransferase [Negativicutes bacterium]
MDAVENGSDIDQRDDARGDDVPLVVDLDGTLIRTDLLVESFFALLSAKPLTALAAVGRLRKGKAQLKACLADHAALDLKTIPFDVTVLDFLHAEKARGRRIYLASASDHRYVSALAAQLGLFDDAFGSTEDRNLTGRAKADLLCAEFGDKGFDYLGNDWVDLTVWKRCRQPLAANVSPRLLRRLQAHNPAAIEISTQKGRFGTYIRALRVHQWLKNFLILGPLLASHQITVGNVAATLLAMIAFSMAASSAYLLNDLLDLPHDRDHATKRFRPMASGAMPLVHGMVLMPLLLIGAAAVGLAVSPAYLAALAVYYGITVAYSLYLKRRLLIDVVTLAVLYTLRILAGGAAIGLAPSPWLFTFSIFLFLCLAVIKRYIELVGRLKRTAGDPGGRGYMLDDLPILSSLAAASGYCSVLVLALYFHSPEVYALYSHPERLWLTGPPLLYWISRMLLLAHRGVLHDDPVVFAVTDRVSLAVGGIILAIVMVAV